MAKIRVGPAKWTDRIRAAPRRLEWRSPMCKTLRLSKNWHLGILFIQGRLADQPCRISEPSVPLVQNLFKSMQQRNITDEEQLVGVIQKVNPPGAPESVRRPHPRCAGKSVEKAAILAMFRDLEVGKSLGFRQEESRHVAIVGEKINLTLNGVAHDAAIPDLKNAPQDRGKHATHHESMTFQRTF